MIIGLTMNACKGLLKVLVPPDETAEIIMLEEILILFHKLLSTQPAVLIEEVDFGDLRSVFTVSKVENACIYQRE